MIAATLFSGIGAPECAMPDWDWRWHAEIEKFPSAVLAARHPTSVNLGDVNAEDFIARAEKAGRPNVLVFGSPCQDFSVAGRRVGLDGDRGNLALVALGIVNRLRPRWVVFENVPGLLSSYSGSAEAERQVREGPVGGRADGDEDSDFAAFLTLVQQCGYLGCYRITDAQYAGVPQRRRRIFAVFHPGDWRPAAAVLFEPEGLRGDNPPGRETGQGVTGTISSRPAGSGGLGTDLDLDGGLISNTITAARGKARSNAADMETFIPIAGTVSSKWAKGSGGPAGDECYNLIAFNGRQDPDVYGDRTGPLDTHPGTQVMAFTSKDYGGDATVDQAPTLRAMENADSHANGGGLTGTAVRRLTPRECERLQAFPDDYTLIRYCGAPAADGPRYKALGNAMNVNEIGWILRRIELFEATVGSKRC